MKKSCVTGRKLRQVIPAASLKGSAYLIILPSCGNGGDNLPILQPGKVDILIMMVGQKQIGQCEFAKASCPPQELILFIILVSCCITLQGCVLHSGGWDCQ